MALQLNSLWHISLSQLIPNEVALWGGVLIGFVGARFYPHAFTRIAESLDTYTTFLLKGMSFLIPPFIIGYIIKLEYEQTLYHILKDYTFIFAVICLTLLIYIFILYFLINRFRITTTLRDLYNMLPAALCGFTTMSSAASMPFTIQGVENNTHNKELARSIVPATVNIHLIGDCLAIPIFAFAVLKSFGLPCPTFWTYLTFTLYFVLAKFSVAAIPGGGIIVMLPILEKYLDFQSDMLTLITALYILFDPIITSVNILGNGAFAKIIDAVVDRR